MYNWRVDFMRDGEHHTRYCDGATQESAITTIKFWNGQDIIITNVRRLT